ncbi:MAG: hypothetical protein FJ317_04230, partial [SAR202 cluster bacterium]|nr:hypothetical protein [SAR202 cluster bacterium]
MTAAVSPDNPPQHYGQAQWQTLTTEQLFERLDSGLGGLTAGQVSARQEIHGPNTIRSDQGVRVWAVLLHQLTSPLIYILIVAAAVTLAIQHWADAAVIGVVVLLNTAIGFVQEYRSENAMRALMGLVAPRARVIRDGREHDVPSESLVPGDIVLLESGVIVPADIRLLNVVRLQLDESILTGESAAVFKSVEPAPVGGPVDIAERKNMVFM